MDQILLECKKCGKIFQSGLAMMPGSSATFINSRVKCRYCGSMENIPDGTFKSTIEGFIQLLQTSNDPLNEAKELLKSLQKSRSEADLETIKRSPKFSKFSNWIPNTPEKIAAYIAIVRVIVSLLTQNPDVNIEYNTFVNQYNKTINISCSQK